MRNSKQARSIAQSSPEAGANSVQDMPRTARRARLAIRPLTPGRWRDLEDLFNARGCSVARRCWCMYYRRSGSRGPGSSWQMDSRTNRAQLRKLVDSGRPPGLIAYRGRVPVGWLSLGPREDFARLERSPVMKAVDEQPVWSLICFVVPAEFRGQGIARALLDGAVEYARKHGARLIEAYPVDRPGRSSAESMWFGAKSMYDRAGFREVARRKADRPIVRRQTRQNRKAGSGAFSSGRLSRRTT